ncbi:MAG: hypothetical protein KH333_06435 [Clostridium sp.]|jgi:hypothetical protein|nr:hypothetical protein [Clostridium sp.]
MRVNLTLNDTNKRDKTIIDFLNSRYSASGYIKELLYQVAKGNNISFISNLESTNKIAKKPKKEDFEEIEGLNDIDL